MTPFDRPDGFTADESDPALKVYTLVFNPPGLAGESVHIIIELEDDSGGGVKPAREKKEREGR